MAKKKKITKREKKKGLSKTAGIIGGVLLLAFDMWIFFAKPIVSHKIKQYDQQIEKKEVTLHRLKQNVNYYKKENMDKKTKELNKLKNRNQNVVTKLEKEKKLIEDATKQSKKNVKIIQKISKEENIEEIIEVLNQQGESTIYDAPTQRAIFEHQVEGGKEK